MSRYFSLMLSGFLLFLSSQSFSEIPITGIYTCYNESNSLRISYMEGEQPSAFFAYRTEENTGVSIPNDNSIYLLDMIEGNMVATINDTTVISFRAPTFMDGTCTRSHDSFGMPIIMPSYCSNKPASITTTTQDGDISVINLQCFYTAQE